MKKQLLPLRQQAGRALKDKRKKMGLTQREAGALLYPPLSAAYIQSVERGIRNLTLDQLDRLSSAIKGRSEIKIK